MKKILLVILYFVLFCMNTYEVRAEKNSTVEFTVTSDDGQSAQALLDGDRNTLCIYRAGTTLHFEADEPVFGIYLEWYIIPDSFTISYNNTISNGKCFLHEYINIDGGAREIDITINSDGYLFDVYVLGNGEIPDGIQKWEEPCHNADILVISTHSDDEILYLGGFISICANNPDTDIQVLYFYDYSNKWKAREHEKLDGLWKLGVKHYPDKGSYEEEWVSSIDDCKKIYGYKDSLGFMVEKIRRYKPLICVTQDENGEYGNPQHRFVVNLVKEAVQICGDNTKYPETAYKYGTHTVLKTYLHMFKENIIRLNTRLPLESFGGMNALEVCQEAFKCHVTQQEFGYFVSDDNKYSIADFGLYAAEPGIDTSGDIFDNIVLYKYSEEPEDSTYKEEQGNTTEALTETSTEEYEGKQTEAVTEEQLHEQTEAATEADTEEQVWTLAEDNGEDNLRTAKLPVILTIISGITAIILIAALTTCSRKHLRGKS